MSDHAPGGPGRPARWTSSAKAGIGTARNRNSLIWFTISHGILNEVYYPRVDVACIRDLGLLVSDGNGFVSEEKRHTTSVVHSLEEGVPVFRVVNTCQQGRYRIEKEIFADPRREVVLQRIRFQALKGKRSDYRLHALLAPHLENHGSDNTGWVDAHKGVPMLFAARADFAVALGCSALWLQRSVGYVGVSDGWQDLETHHRMTWTYDRAEHGNVALTGTIDLEACNGEFVLALGFGALDSEAGHRVLGSLNDNFDVLRDEYRSAWQDWQRVLLPMDEPRRPHDIYRVSTAVLRTHEAKHFPGGVIASLSIPWGATKGDDDLGGYHLVWPRDLVETAGGLLAAGARDDASRVLSYFRITQEADGHWPQNMWLDGRPYWDGIQMDETALPIVLVDMLQREVALSDAEVDAYWPMIRRAAGFIVRNGPVTQEDRWEEDAGYSPFTLAAEIAALLIAAEHADHHQETALAGYLRETADVWHDSIDRWIYSRGGELCGHLGIDGYYVRVAPPDSADAASPLHGFVPIKNRPVEKSEVPAEEMVSPDALALVRFGLRAADDPRMANTVRVLDELLKVELPQGPVWYRYNQDGYGEHEDGRAFDGTGVGRAWPLLVGERAHFELAAGRRAEAERLLGVLEGCAAETGLLPEQVWDADDIPALELFRGRPTGSAMPLVWAHSEYIKLRRSLREGRVFDMPPQTVQRYLVDRVESPFAFWRFNHKCSQISAGKVLRLEVLAPALVHWSVDDWQTIRDVPTRPTDVGMHLADLPTSNLGAGRHIRFTFRWTESAHWEGRDFEIVVVPS